MPRRVAIASLFFALLAPLALAAAPSVEAAAGLNPPSQQQTINTGCNRASFAPTDNGKCGTVVCPTGQTCRNGKCEGDPCANVVCPTGQTCKHGRCHTAHLAATAGGVTITDLAML